MKDIMKNYHTFDELIKLINASGKAYNIELINKAYDVAYNAHKGQKRVSGLDYIYHPISVAYILVEMGMDSASVVAAILHDVIEDTKVTQNDLKQMFGKEIATLVEGVTKFKKIPSSSREEQQAEDIKKVLRATSHDLRVIMIKLADRLQNMRTIDCMDPQKKREKSLQNMEVYAPIAHRLGIRTIKDELEDISLRCLDPIACEEIESSVALRKDDREKFINLIQKRITDRIQKFVPDIYIEGRVKSINEIYKKMFMKGKSMDQIYDIYAVRVIVNTIQDCYYVFGIMHDMFQPIPSRFKDYIATPKKNMYQSLHTTVLSREGIPFEIQIRTWEMHRTAEYGIAAHWKYKLKIGENDNSLIGPMSWVRKLIDNHRDSDDVTDVVNNIKSDLIPKEIFVLTPRSDVISLPAGSTVVDFAYAIHTDLGNSMVGANVNKKLVPVNYILKTGEIVEILRSKDPNKGPARNWFRFVKTSEARNKIKQWFKKEKHSENVAEGKLEVKIELEKNNIFISESEYEKFFESELKKNQCNNMDDFFAAIGYGGIQLWKIMPRLNNEYLRRKRKGNQNLKNSFEDVFQNTDNPCSRASCVKLNKALNFDIKFSRCCGPIPGDEIIGFITNKNMISIHRCNCSYVKNHIYKPDNSGKWVQAYWNEIITALFETTIEITSQKNEYLLSEIINKILSMKLKVISFSSNTIIDNRFILKLTLNVRGTEHLMHVIENLEKIRGIIGIRRI